MWTHCITSISHVLKLNGYGGRQAKVNEKSLCFKGGETLGSYFLAKCQGAQGQITLIWSGKTYKFVPT